MDRLHFACVCLPNFSPFSSTVTIHTHTVLGIFLCVRFSFFLSFLLHKAAINVPKMFYFRWSWTRRSFMQRTSPTISLLCILHCPSLLITTYASCQLLMCFYTSLYFFFFFHRFFIFRYVPVLFSSAVSVLVSQNKNYVKFFLLFLRACACAFEFNQVCRVMKFFFFFLPCGAVVITYVSSPYSSSRWNR
uniref:Uncharacterized protein n=1 Tax=Trypanosoma vivax (strain Y486) TaxID=1055687 RepID=G0U5I5_TRYVY|nr:hypothetical protein TVY486_1001890 [Trypanosoma vivax Y486]